MDDLKLALSHYPARSAEPLLDSCVGGILRLAAADTPDAVALLAADADGTPGRQWTYAQLLADSERLAHALMTRYQPGERIALWAPNIPEWIICEFAIGLAGLVLVTVNPGYQPRELKYVLEQSRASGLFLVSEHRGNPMATIAADVVADIPAIREVIDMEDHAALYRKGDLPGSLPDVDSSDPAQIQYTSGTTGFPKGVVLHHHGLTNNARQFYTLLGARKAESVLAVMPLFHTAGGGMTVLGAIQFGCRLVLPRQFDGASAIALIENEAINLILCVPTMLIMMLEADDATPRNLDSIRVVASGGSMVPPELIRRITTRFNCGFSTVYGQTESSPLLTMTQASDSFSDLCETIGRPLPDTEISIRDPHSNSIVALDTVGEICARAYSVMLGYNDDPEATARAIDGEGWLHTGDLGTIDSRGFMRITGRVKDMIIRGGENLFPAEIENILLEHPDVAEVAVVGVPDSRMGEAAAAFVRMKSGARLDTELLVAHCRANLAAQKTPTHWVEISEWPLTGSGKIQKFALRDQWIATNIQ